MEDVRRCSRPMSHWNRSSGLLILKRNAFRHLLTLHRNHLQHRILIRKLTYASLCLSLCVCVCVCVCVCLCTYKREVLFNDAVFCSDYVTLVADEWNTTEHWWNDADREKRKMSMEKNPCQRPIAHRKSWVVKIRNKRTHSCRELDSFSMFSVYLLTCFLHGAESFLTS